MRRAPPKAPCRRAPATTPLGNREHTHERLERLLRAASRVLPPAALHRAIVLTAATPARIIGLRTGIALEKEAEAVVVAARHAVIDDRRPARDEAALRLVGQHRDELGA